MYVGLCSHGAGCSVGARNTLLWTTSCVLPVALSATPVAPVAPVAVWLEEFGDLLLCEIEERKSDGCGVTNYYCDCYYNVKIPYFTI